jgi:hypothetical protein
VEENHRSQKELRIMAEQLTERRRSQRVDANLKLEVKLPLADQELQAANLETLNISSSGVYFKSDHFIEPMTKLEMLLELPVGGSAAGDAPNLATVQCEGIVVRVSPEQSSEDSDHYEIAVFFTDIKPEGLRSLEDHITHLLATV